MDKKIKKRGIFLTTTKKFDKKIKNFCKINIFLHLLLLKGVIK